MKVLTIGSATQDIFLHNAPDTPFILQEGSKIELANISYFIGGGATNGAVSFAKLGFDVSVMCKVGQDNQAQAVLHALRGYGIHVEWVTVSPNVPTGVSIIIPWPSGDRTIWSYRAANEQLTYHDIVPAALDGLDQIYITSLTGPACQLLLHIVHAAKKRGIAVAVNPGGSQLRQGAPELYQALPYIDTFICNMQEAQEFMASFTKEQFSMKAYAAHIIAAGVRTVAITDGKHGVHVVTCQQQYFHPALPVTIGNTLGAGDAFGSCFVAFLAMGKSVQEALHAGVIQATSVISQIGPKEGLLTLAQLNERIAQSG